MPYLSPTVHLCSFSQLHATITLAMNALVSLCASILTSELHEYLLEYQREKFLPREAFLLQPGEICRHLYFVESGLLRCFYRQDDKEISSRFVQPGEICWSAESFLRQQKGIEYIQALERTHVVTLSFPALLCICLDFPQFEKAKQKWIEDFLIDGEQRMQAMWMQRSNDKLAWFEKRFPALLEKVWGKYIASYLGITEVMLSRLRHR